MTALKLLVQKFGGTSVDDIERLKIVAKLVDKTRRAGYSVVVVVSAMGDTTDHLLKQMESLRRTRPPPGAVKAMTPSNLREMDALLATGEQVSSALLATALYAIGHDTRSLNGAQAGIYTDQQHGRARIQGIDTSHVRQLLQENQIPVVAGFQGVAPDGSVTTLGRGGSDTTAVALAAALEAEECRIYTDVDGVYTADPRIVLDARRIAQLTYEEMLEFSSLGTKVMHSRAVEFAGKHNVPLRVLSSFRDGPGTLIAGERPAGGSRPLEQPLITGVACNQDEAKLTVSGIPDKPGIADDILGPIARVNIEVDMIVQNVGEHGLTDLTFTVHRRDYLQARELLGRVAEKLGARGTSGDSSIGKLSIVGVGMRSHAGIASRMFQALAREDINIMMISTSEIKISVVVKETHLETGVKALHRAFELEWDKPGQEVVSNRSQGETDPAPRQASQV